MSSIIVSERPDEERDESLSEKLERIMLLLTGPCSDLARVLLLPEAKRTYEELHPEAVGWGGDRQVEKISACPSFETYVAARAGVVRRTVKNWLAVAAKLPTLGEAARQATFGTSLANRLDLLVRVAAIPKQELQLDLVHLFDRSRKKAKRELEGWEEHFGIESPNKAKKQAAEKEPVDEVEPQAEELDADDEADIAFVEHVTAAPDILAAIMTELGVGAPEYCVPEIRRLHENQAAIFTALDVSYLEDALDKIERLRRRRRVKYAKCGASPECPNKIPDDVPMCSACASRAVQNDNEYP